MNPIEFHRIRTTSKDFWLASVLCKPNSFGDPLGPRGSRYAIEPWLVLLAFSAEVGLKALVMILRDKKMRGHELQPLFLELPAEEQAHIVAQTGLERSEFDTRLATMNKAFVEWRYLYERPSFSIDLVFPPKFAGAVQLLLDRYWPPIQADETPKL